MKQSPIKRQGARGKIKSREEHKLKQELISELPVNGNGEKVCPKCLELPDFRGWGLAHIISKARGGSTNRTNCWVGCYRCHNSDDKAIGGHNLNEKFASPQWGARVEGRNG